MRPADARVRWLSRHREERDAACRARGVSEPNRLDLLLVARAEPSAWPDHMDAVTADPRLAQDLVDRRLRIERSVVEEAGTLGCGDAGRNPGLDDERTAGHAPLATHFE